MKIIGLPLLIAPALLFAGCSRPPATTTDGNSASVGGGAAPVAPAPSPAASAAANDSAPAESAYLGRWIGVEGMYLDVARNPAGGVTLDMQWDLDHKGTFDGSVTAEGLRFIRNGVAETARPTDGDATGLKYLAGKRDCLTVKPGEGYCR